MTQTKLEILGPYTPEHEGLWVLKNSERETQCIVHSVVNGTGFITIHGNSWPVLCVASQLMNAREVPLAREFWVNEYFDGSRSVYSTQEEAQKFIVCLKHTIHLREVLPGEGV